MPTPLNLGPSKQVQGGHYDHASQDLTLHLNGGSYVYHDVPASEVDDLEKSPSHGDHFHGNIRGKYKFTKL